MKMGWRDHGLTRSVQAEIRNTKKKEIGEFGVGRPDFGGRWPRGEALGQKKNKKRVTGLGASGDRVLPAEEPRARRRAARPCAVT